jgi:hypothetical protein
MAKFPGMVVHGPTFDEEKLTWHCTAIAVTPCRETISRTSTEKSQAKAKSASENSCDAGIKRHMKTCKDCPEHIKKKYG